MTWVSLLPRTTVRLREPVLEPLPDSILRNDFIAVLAAFVAINTIVYVTLAVAKILPKFYLRDWLAASNRRSETRSIHPDAAIGGPTGGQHAHRHDGGDHIGHARGQVRHVSSPPVIRSRSGRRASNRPASPGTGPRCP